MTTSADQLMYSSLLVDWATCDVEQITEQKGRIYIRKNRWQSKEVGEKVEKAVDRGKKADDRVERADDRAERVDYRV